MQNYGIELGTEMCRAILDAGIPGLHMYTLNLERCAVGILERLGLLDLERIPRSLPWRHIPNTSQRATEVRGDANRVGQGRCCDCGGCY